MLSALKQTATNSATPGITGASGATIGLVAWMTENVTFLTVSLSIFMAVITGVTAYTSWRFKSLENARKEAESTRRAEMDAVDLSIKTAQLAALETPAAHNE